VTGSFAQPRTLVIEHVTRLAHLSYRVVISGEPDIDCTMAATLRDPARAGVSGMMSGAAAMMATAMRVVNAVPYVVDAAPGVLSSLDLPVTIPRNAFRRG
jgi:hypothetical protein